MLTFDELMQISWSLYAHQFSDLPYGDPYLAAMSLVCIMLLTGAVLRHMFRIPG
ncbi:MAG: hypothetical protein H7840_03975 [Alphaproteobacteria bacterium]